MSLWFWVLVACGIAYGTKLVGYMVPGSWLRHPQVARISGLMTIALLAGLVAMNTAGDGGGVAFDARIGALAAAALALLLRAPFIVVVIVGALAAAALRAVGWG